LLLVSLLRQLKQERVVVVVAAYDWLVKQLVLQLVLLCLHQVVFSPLLEHIDVVDVFDFAFSEICHVHVFR
jgi:hypothetical protein